MKKIILGLLLASTMAQAKWVKIAQYNVFGDKLDYKNVECLATTDSGKIQISTNGIFIKIKAPKFYKPNNTKVYIRFNKDKVRIFRLQDIQQKDGHLVIHLDRQYLKRTNFIEEARKESLIDVGLVNDKGLFAVHFTGENSELAKDDLNMLENMIMSNFNNNHQ